MVKKKLYFLKVVFVIYNKLTEKEIKLDFSGNDIAEEINEKVLGLKDV